ncbi:iron-containing alcohol dehydrogenase [Streptomyces sp. NBC_00059]|uniref:3-dehydroquinate synthase family protein n=1 Tax=Streptomyces sp. NBC_00059 TaxID=2975635 RepID=UPI002253E338|nr:iron-containing alcohol dehydrogenase [Streptomyces sp. NBC_00059]MCX5416001.1 iron-containing alcohol dehydrogenase [Streptomyces sp. NBC_00059]
MRTGTMSFGETKVPYLYGDGCTSDIVTAIRQASVSAGSLLFVVDANVRAHAEAIVAELWKHLRVEVHTVRADERSKTLGQVEAVLEHAALHGIDRGSAVVAMGGGLTANVAGLAAALLYRGTSLIHLPTTPVAAFDAVFSLKQGVNLSTGKNQCGTYFPPSLIACDYRWLTTIPRAEVLTGLAEMAKNVLTVLPGHEARFRRAVERLDGDFTGAMDDLCETGIAAKAPYLSLDPREHGEALVFEYGHTVGHAIEFVSRGEISHGEAVAWGMLTAAETGLRLGLLERSDVDRHRRVISTLHLPDVSRRVRALPTAGLRQVLLGDNKRGRIRCAPDEIPMVLMGSDGAPVRKTAGSPPLTAVPVDVVMTALETVRETW